MTTGSGRRGTVVHGLMSSTTNPCRQGYVSIRYNNSIPSVTGSLITTGNMVPGIKESILLLQMTMTINPKNILKKGIRRTVRGSVTKGELSLPIYLEWQRKQSYNRKATTP